MCMAKKPGYQQKDFGEAQGLTLVISPDGEAGSLQIKQDARLHQLILPANAELSFATNSNRHYYVHQIDGSLIVKGDDGKEETLLPGDGIKIESLNSLSFSAKDAPVKALVFDLP